MAVGLQPVGVDIEHLRLDRVIRPAHAAGVLSSRELEGWQRLGDRPRAELYYRCWTIKEAFLKLHGRGLTVRPNLIETVDLSSGQNRSKIEAMDSNLGPAHVWQLAIGQDRVGALASTDRSKNVLLRSWGRDRLPAKKNR